MARKPAFVRHSATREAEIQARLLSVLEARFSRRFAKEVKRESLALIDAYAELGFMPPVSDQHAQVIRALYLDLAKRSAFVFGRRVVVQGKAVGADIETKAEGFWERLFEAAAQAWVNLERVRRRIVGVTETTRDRLVAEVARGQEEGLGVDAIARQMNKNVPTVSKYRGALIARTETHGAANFGAFEAARQTGLDLRKEWISVIDARTRRFSDGDAFDHLSMNGQVVAMDEPFLMPQLGGEPIPAMYPGDVNLPAGASINCRCAVGYTVVGLDD